MKVKSSIDAHPDKGWIEDLLEALHQAHDAEGIFAVIERAARTLGSEHCAYGMRTSMPFSNPRFELLSNYDMAWRERYLSANYLAIDPTVHHGMRSFAPVLWSDDLFQDTPQMWSEARSFGLRFGWAQSCFDECSHVGMLTLARAHEPLTSAELRAHEPYLRCLANVAHGALAAALRERLSPHSPVLTAREAEVMKWTAEGKTSDEVAGILGVSAHTANFHLRNAIEKLQAPNRAAAVARAVTLRLFR